MHKVRKYIAEDLKFSNQTINEMKFNSKNFYKNIKERRSIREFSKDKIDINVILIIKIKLLKLKIIKNF